jgi:hypothetical protein
MLDGSAPFSVLPSCALLSGVSQTCQSQSDSLWQWKWGKETMRRSLFFCHLLALHCLLQATALSLYHADTMRGERNAEPWMSDLDTACHWAASGLPQRCQIITSLQGRKPHHSWCGSWGLSTCFVPAMGKGPFFPPWGSWPHASGSLESIFFLIKTTYSSQDLSLVNIQPCPSATLLLPSSLLLTFSKALLPFLWHMSNYILYYFLSWIQPDSHHQPETPHWPY